ncbi:MAG: NAD-dependent epimerase/dehydratase family protein [Frankiales bacterium]|nr:NAD-dependent epimerase/dehydratase family protein [Frankiales bacterium]
MRIVVTGATGNVGSRLLPQLLDSPQVTSVVGLARRLPADRGRRVEWTSVDLAEDELRPLLRGADVVVHLAFLLQPAHDPDEMHRVNIEGTRRLLDAVVAEGVPAFVQASSVGAYSPAPASSAAERFAEDHPTQGVSSSTYSRHKAQVERMLDALEAEHPERRVVRIRPGIVLQGDAASALARYFLGPFVPQSLVRRALLPVVPKVDRLAIQAVHAEDAARAFFLAATTPVTGAFNVAAEPVLDADTLSEALGARQLPLPVGLVRALVDLTWRLHLQPTDPGWVDLGRLTPIMDTRRAREVLGWTPTHRATDALVETVDAMGRGQGADTPVLRPRSLPGRALEVVRALTPGARGTG